MSPRIIRPLTALALLLTTSCGDDDNSPAAVEPVGAAADGKVGTSDPDTVIDALNSAEWKDACVDIATAGNNRELSQAPCKLLGLVASVIGQSCMQSYELCTQGQGDLECDDKPSSCTATLREADACNVAALRWLQEQTRDIDCTSSLSALAKIDQNYVPPECQLVQQKCPDFVWSGSDDGTTFDDF